MKRVAGNQPGLRDYHSSFPRTHVGPREPRRPLTSQLRRLIKPAPVTVGAKAMHPLEVDCQRAGGEAVTSPEPHYLLLAVMAAQEIAKHELLDGCSAKS